jgi:glycosyltransferase involved in cell wall biosynthesis
MKLINTTNNTIYLDDLDEYLPFDDGKPFDVSFDKLKKSRCLRNTILSGALKIHDYDPNEQIEASLSYMVNKINQERKVEPIPKEEVDDILPIPPSLIKSNSDIEIKVRGLFYDTSGYAKVNRNLVSKLVQMGYKVKVDPKKGQNQLGEQELKNLVPLEKTKISRNHILIDSIIPSFSEVGTGKYKILYTTIESYTIPKQFEECCKLYDEIWLTSDWSASILRKSIKDKPIYSVITGVDTDLYTENGAQYDFGSSVKKFIFISVFNWGYRKGPDVLLKAYFDEFSSNDDVTLLIMSRYQGGRTKFHKDKIKFDIDEIMTKFPNKDMPHVVRFSQQLSEKDMPKLYRSAHAFILTSRGEGGCLTPLEASMCGMPVIMTNCSGQQGYLRPDNSYMIEIDRLKEIQPGQMGLHYWDGQQFPDLTSNKVHDQVKRAMRSVYENYAEAKNRNRNMQKFILENFTWNHTANAAAERINDIARR